MSEALKASTEKESNDKIMDAVSGFGRYPDKVHAYTEADFGVVIPSSLNHGAFCVDVSYQKFMRFLITWNRNLN